LEIVFCVAVIVTVVEPVTFLWVTVNVAVVFPAGTVTEAGTPAALMAELFRAIAIPPVGAGPERVTVPLTTVVETPFTVPGETETELNVGAVIVSGADFDPDR
jgi:hypothetical protein